METINNIPESLSKYIERKDIFNQSNLPLTLRYIDTSIFNVMGEDDYEVLLSLGLIDPQQINLKDFILKLRVGERYLGVFFEYFADRVDIQNILKELDELKTNLQSQNIDLENYGKQQIYILNGIRALKVILKDFLHGNEDIDLLLCLIVLRNVSILLESNFIFLSSSEEWLKRFKKGHGIEF